MAANKNIFPLLFRFKRYKIFRDPTLISILLADMDMGGSFFENLKPLTQ
jgi:hypothetical protein